MLTIEEIKKVIAKIAPEYNLKRVTLFGSRANGNFREDSDIDLIVDFPNGSTFLNLISLVHVIELRCCEHVSSSCREWGCPPVVE